MVGDVLGSDVGVWVGDGLGRDDGESVGSTDGNACTKTEEETAEQLSGVWALRPTRTW